MVPAVDEKPLPRKEARTEERAKTFKKVSWYPGESSRESENLESGQPSTSDTSTVVPPGSAWTGEQGAACPHEAHCERHMA